MSDRTTVILSGDGGFLYNSQELSTAVQYGINVVVIVFNDNAYGNVLRAQTEDFRGHVIGTKLHNPDFLSLARSYGVTAIKADGPDELGSAIIEVEATNSPVLIEVPVGEMERIY
jgi:acetolactate synthase-1/2/3 large subunit